MIDFLHPLNEESSTKFDYERKRENLIVRYIALILLIIINSIGGKALVARLANCISLASIFSI
jgi:hypothetical protein